MHEVEIYRRSKNVYSQFEEAVGEEEGWGGHVQFFKPVTFSILCGELPSLHFRLTLAKAIVTS